LRFYKNEKIKPKKMFYGWILCVGAVLGVLGLLLSTPPPIRPGTRSSFRSHPSWNGSLRFSFINSKRVLEATFNVSCADEFFSSLFEKNEAVVVKDSPVLLWPALSKWQDRTVLAKMLGQTRVHLPSNPVVRTHHTGQPFEAYANWSRPFFEASLAASDLLRGDILAYGMFNVGRLPEIAKDIDVKYFTIPWRGALEVNLWIGGTSGITTPAHYDS
jgi:hypothetical protein